MIIEKCFMLVVKDFFLTESVYHTWLSWVFVHLNMKYEKTVLCFSTGDLFLVLVFNVSAGPAFWTNMKVASLQSLIWN